MRHRRPTAKLGCTFRKPDDLDLATAMEAVALAMEQIVGLDSYVVMGSTTSNTGFSMTVSLNNTWDMKTAHDKAMAIIRHLGEQQNPEALGAFDVTTVSVTK